ncbi:MAG: hypothetical protein V3U32_03980 [Anaerolineales bacterium]
MSRFFISENGIVAVLGDENQLVTGGILKINRPLPFERGRLIEISRVGGASVTIETEVPMSVDYFILSLMRPDRNHYQRVEVVRRFTSK